MGSLAWPLRPWFISWWTSSALGPLTWFRPSQTRSLLRASAWPRSPASCTTKSCRTTRWATNKSPRSSSPSGSERVHALGRDQSTYSSWICDDERYQCCCRNNIYYTYPNRIYRYSYLSKAILASWLGMSPTKTMQISMKEPSVHTWVQGGISPLRHGPPPPAKRPKTLFRT